MDAKKDSIEVLVQDHEIRLIGILTFNTSAKALGLIKKYLESLAKNNQNEITLNLSQVTRSDSSGLSVLSGIMREAKKNKVILKIKNVPEKLFNLARLSGLDSILLGL